MSRWCRCRSRIVGITTMTRNSCWAFLLSLLLLGDGGGGGGVMKTTKATRSKAVFASAETIDATPTRPSNETTDLDDGVHKRENNDNSTTSRDACPLGLFIPFSDGRRVNTELSIPADTDSVLWNRRVVAEQGYGLLASAIMAIQHFNQRNSSIVPNLSQLLDEPQCRSIRLPFDTTNELLQVKNTNRNPETTAGGLIGPSDSSSSSSSGVPCYVVGPMDLHAAAFTGSISQVLKVPMLNYGMMPDHYARPGSFPTVVRTVDMMDRVASSLVEYLHGSPHHRSYFHILDDGGSFAKEFRTELSLSARNIGGMTVESTSIEEDSQSIIDDVRAALELVKRSGYGTIVSLLSRDYYIDALARVADDMGMLTDDYWWIFTDETFPRHRLPYWNMTVDSPHYRLLKGSGLIQMLDGHDWHLSLMEEDPFLKSWKEQNDTLVEIVNGLYPRETTKGVIVEGRPDYFQTTTPPPLSSHMYDTVMALGLALCRDAASPPPPSPPSTPTRDRVEGEVGEGDPPPLEGGDVPPGGGRRDLQGGGGPPPPRPLPPLISAVLEVEFDGASGRFAMNAGRRSRESGTVVVGMYNFQPRSSSTATTSVTNFDAVLTDIQLKKEKEEEVLDSSGSSGGGGGVGGSGGTLEWVPVSDYVFRDGTTTPPRYDIFISEFNYLPTSIRVTCLAFMSFSMILCMMAVAFIFGYRKERIVKASQPEFLYLLCFGAFVLSASILPMSFDERSLGSTSKLTVACMTVPWLIFSGYLMIYLALFSKLWRIQKVMQMRRRKVAAWQVMGPFGFFMLACVAVLVTFTVVSPWTWERDFVRMTPPETLGSCQSDHAVLFFCLLTGLCFLATVLTGYMCMKTKDIPTEFSDSHQCWYTILTHLQSIVVGLPVVVMLEGESMDLPHLGSSLLISTIAVSSVTILLGPKVCVVFQSKLPGWNSKNNGEHTWNTNRPMIRISGVSPPVTSNTPAMLQATAAAMLTCHEDGQRHVTHIKDHSVVPDGYNTHRSLTRFKHWWSIGESSLGSGVGSSSVSLDKPFHNNDKNNRIVIISNTNCITISGKNCRNECNSNVLSRIPEPGVGGDSPRTIAAKETDDIITLLQHRIDDLQAEKCRLLQIVRVQAERETRMWMLKSGK